MKESFCEKITLANSMGIRLTYCADCNVVELEIGAISLRLNPDVIQQVANMMMKASLQLEHIEAVKSNEIAQNTRLRMTH